MVECKAPAHIPYEKGQLRLFLAGSIEMGKARLWQDEILKELKDMDDLIVLNPRREDWDPTWVQDITCGPFREQVLWEFRNLRNADIVFFNIEPETMSPITLFELGYIIGIDTPLVIRCAKGFWRKGNIDVYAWVEGFKVYEDWGESIEALKDLVQLIA